MKKRAQIPFSSSSRKKFTPTAAAPSTLDQMNKFIDEVALSRELKSASSEFRRPSVQQTVAPRPSNLLLETARSADLDQYQWTELRAKQGPEGRAHHSTTLYENHVYLIGGRDLSLRTFSDIWRFSLTAREWKRMQVEGRIPPLSNHSAVLIRNQIFIYGGLSSKNTQNYAIYVYDIELNSWKLVKSYGPSPAPRDDHAAVADGDRGFYVFGGFTGNQKNAELWHFSLDTYSWRNCASAPCPRSGHSLVRAGDWVYLFGGCDEDGQRLRDLWRFRVGQEEWLRISAMSGQIPQARSGHSAVVFGQKMLVFGGMHGVLHENNELYILDLNSYVWTQLCRQRLCTTPTAFMLTGQDSKVLQSSPGAGHSSRGGFYLTKSMNSFASSPKNRKSSRIIIPSLKKKMKVSATSLTRRKPPPSPDASLSAAYLRVTSAASPNGPMVSSSSVVPRQMLNNSSLKPYKRHLPPTSYISRLLSPSDLAVPGFKIKVPFMEAMKESYLFKNVNTTRVDFRKSKRIFQHELLLKPTESKAMALPGRRPPAREGHSAIALNANEMLIFGGDRNRMSFNDMYLYDLELKEPPPPPQHERTSREG